MYSNVTIILFMKTVSIVYLKFNEKNMHKMSFSITNIIIYVLLKCINRLHFRRGDILTLIEVIYFKV